MGTGKVSEPTSEPAACPARAAARSPALPLAPADRSRPPAPVTATQDSNEDRVGAVPVRPELGAPSVRFPATQVRYLRQQRRAVDHLEICAASQDVIEDAPGLGEVRRASDIGDKPTCSGRVNCRTEKRALQVAQIRDVGGIPPPASLRTAAQAAES